MQPEKKRRISRKGILMLTIIGVVLIVLVVGLVLLLSRGQNVEETLTPQPFSSDDQYFALGNNIVYAQEDLLTCIDSSLETVWQLQIFTSDFRLETRDSVIAIVGDNFVQAIDADGKHLCSTQTEGIIRDVRVCKNKFAAHIDRENGDDTLSYIVIFDMNANNIYQVKITGRHMLDFGFDAQSDLLYILELDATGAAPVSRISTYRPETESMTSIKEQKGQLISELFMLEESVYTMSTSQLTIYPPRGADKRETMVYGWVLEDSFLEDDPKFVYIPTQNAQGDIDTVRIVKASGGETTINLPPEVFRVLHTGERIYGFASRNIFVYTSEGKYMRTHELPFEIDTVEKAMERFVFITVDQTVYLLPLP